MQRVLKRRKGLDIIIDLRDVLAFVTQSQNFSFFGNGSRKNLFIKDLIVDTCKFPLLPFSCHYHRHHHCVNYLFHAAPNDPTHLCTSVYAVIDTSQAVKH